MPFLVALLFGYFARHYEHAPAWRVQYAVGVVFAIAVGAAFLVLFVRRPRSRSRATRVRPAFVIGLAIVLVVVVGWPIQRVYFDRRYRALDLRQDPFSLPFNDRHDQRVALFRSADEYALYGSDLTNIVRRLDAPDEAPKPSALARRIESCRAWRTKLRDEQFDYVIVLTETFTPGPSPEPWVSMDAASSLVDRGPNYRVHHIVGALDPDECTRAARAEARDQPEASSNTPST